MGKGKLMRSQAKRASHESPGEDCEQSASSDSLCQSTIPGRGTTDAIFVVRHLQVKYLAANKRPYIAFKDLEKEFECLKRSSGGR